VDYLLRSGADVNVRRRDGETALHVACDSHVARILLNHGAKIDTRDSKGSSVLFSAVSSGHRSIVNLLLERSADANEFDYMRRSVFHVVSDPDIAKI
jgi:FOG: Ankyrin repeat